MTSEKRTAPRLSRRLFLLASFPFLHVCSPQFLLSLGLLVASHYLWAVHFMAHYHSLTHVLCFLLFNQWLLPFGFFISLSANEATLPDRLGGGGGGGGLFPQSSKAV